MKKDFLELCELIINASLYWSSEDEERNPHLKKLRTLAGYYLNSEKKDSETKNIKKLKTLIKEIGDIVDAGIEEFENSIELQIAIDQAINLRYFFEKWLSTKKES